MTDTPTNSLEWVWFIAQKYSDLFIRGTLLTLAVSVTGTIAGFLLGYIVGIVQDTKINKEDYFFKRAMLRFFKVLSAVYVELFRGTPMIVQAMIVFYGLRQAGLEIDPISAGILVTSSTPVHIWPRLFAAASIRSTPDSARVRLHSVCLRSLLCSGSYFRRHSGTSSQKWLTPS